MGTCHSFRLPSNRYQKFVVQGDKVACISMDIHSMRPRVSLNIVTWDLLSKAHRHTSLDAPWSSGVDLPDTQIDCNGSWDTIRCTWLRWKSVFQSLESQYTKSLMVICPCSLAR